MIDNIAVSKDKIADFCLRHHIRKLAFFGSVIRDDFGPDSDFDILVEFDSDYTPGFAFFGMETELSEIFGWKVELHTRNFLSRYFRDKVLEEAEIQYVNVSST